jgi:hypothetical protein
MRVEAIVRLLKGLWKKHRAKAYIAIPVAAIIASVWVAGSANTIHDFWQNFKGGKESNKPSTSPVNVVVNPKSPDYFPGTKLSREDMEQIFPFGYALIYFGENERFTYEVSENGLMEWDIDWKHVEIALDRQNGKVSIGVPAKVNSGKDFPNGNRITVSGPEPTGFVRFGFNMPFENGACSLVRIINLEHPTLHAMVVSNNQRKPVFAIGLRIPETPNPSN